MMGNIISGNVATCLMSTTWLTAKLTCIRARALSATPIVCNNKIRQSKNNSYVCAMIVYLFPYRLNINEELVLLRIRFADSFYCFSQLVIGQMEVRERNQNRWVCNNNNEKSEFRTWLSFCSSKQYYTDRIDIMTRWKDRAVHKEVREDRSSHCLDS